MYKTYEAPVGHVQLEREIVSGCGVVGEPLLLIAWMGTAPRGERCRADPAIGELNVMV